MILGCHVQVRLGPFSFTYHSKKCVINILCVMLLLYEAKSYQKNNINKLFLDPGSKVNCDYKKLLL